MDHIIYLSEDCTHYIQLEEHPSARNRAVASEPLSSNQVVFKTRPLTSVLLPEAKGRRCDSCHCLASHRSPLLKCSGCGSFWYCGVDCQNAQWKAHHRRICKAYNGYVASFKYQALSVNEKVDALLLSQLLVQLYPKDDFDSIPSAAKDPLVSTFFDLLEGPIHIDLPPLCRTVKANDVPADLKRKCFSRFGNNNFALHSHLNTYAHGMYPMASRLFNHSCMPNCVAKYRIVPKEPVKMEIIALRDITEGEELTIPYLDPALPYETRQAALKANHGFRCTCPLCNLESRIHPVPPLPEGSEELFALADRLREFVENKDGMDDAPLLFSVPEEFYSLLNESCLPTLSEEFSRSSHEGEYDAAILTGRRLLSLYKVLYPAKYPQIGMHALELAKTAWNAVATAGTNAEPSELRCLEDQARSSLGVARRILRNYGEEGDEGGPLEEIRVLQGLLEDEGMMS